MSVEHPIAVQLDETPFVMSLFDRAVHGIQHPLRDEIERDAAAEVLGCPDAGEFISR